MGGRTPSSRRRRLRSRGGRGRGLRVAIAPLLALVGCSDAGGPGPALLVGYDVVLVVVDALRADHLGTYGYARNTSPVIDALASEGVVFEDAIANSSYTRESVAALLTGQLPSRSGATGWRAQPGTLGPHLGESFRGAGYRTGFLSNTVQLDRPGFTRGFDEVQHLRGRWNLSGEGRRLSDDAIDFARRAGAHPLFLYLHYLDPHGPYRPRAELRARFAPEPVAEPLALYDDVQARLAELTSEGLGPGDPRFDDLVARYDAEIAATDEALGRLLEGLRTLGRLERTLVVLTADHGEEFLEHGYVEHAWTLYRESVHVPLIFWAGEALTPARSEAPVSLVDVAPTLLALLGIGAGSALDGRSLLDPRTGAPARDLGGRPRLGELLLRERNQVRSLTQDGWKYVAVYRWVPPGQRHGARASGASPTEGTEPIREELYDLARDPLERQDRSGEEPERLAALREAMRRTLASARRAAPTPRPAEPEIPPETLERLRALGYREAD